MIDAAGSSDGSKGEVERTETAKWMIAKSNPPRFREVAFEKISDISDEKMHEYVDAAVRRATKREEDMIRKWEGEGGKSKL